MKKLLVVVVLLLYVLSIVGCRAGNGKRENDKDEKKVDKSSNKHFSAAGISFDYPGSWKSISEIFPTYKPGHDNDLDAEQLGCVVDAASSTRFEKFTTSVKIEKKEMPSGSNIKDVFDQTYRNYANKSLVAMSEKTYTTGGSIAYEKVYKRPHGEPWYQIRDVWLEKNGTIYIISCSAFPQSFARAQEDFDEIISSFKIK